MMTHWILLLLFSNFFSFLVLRKKINRREFNTVLIECRSVHNRVHTYDMIAMWHFRSLISIYTLNKYETKCRFMYVMISVADDSLDTYLSILQQISRGYIYINLCSNLSITFSFLDFILLEWCHYRKIIITMLHQLKRM